MRRRLFTLLSALSLVLCLGVCAMWISSYWLEEGYILTLRNSPSFNFVVFRSGGIEYVRARDFRNQNQNPAELVQVNWRFAGFWHESQDASVSIGVPYWSVALLFSCMPGIWFWVRIRRRDSVPGRCCSCCYDLRATPDRCPECGMVPQT
ncbi:MAG TPA: hypothetical protein VFC78_10305, partial [Tepidisphaeraceae bacterium]|nr:hypothetical protein [Tepidisphaeraceae bacterium]